MNAMKTTGLSTLHFGGIFPFNANQATLSQIRSALAEKAASQGLAFAASEQTQLLADSDQYYQTFYTAEHADTFKRLEPWREAIRAFDAEHPNALALVKNDLVITHREKHEKPDGKPNGKIVTTYHLYPYLEQIQNGNVNIKTGEFIQPPTTQTKTYEWFI